MHLKASLSSKGFPVALLAALLTPIFLLAPSLAPAQPASQPAAQAEDGEVTVKDLKALATTIENEGQRKQLLDTIHALIEVKKRTSEKEQPASLGGTLIAVATQAAEETGKTLSALAKNFRNMPVLVDWFRRQATSAQAREKWLLLLVELAAIVAVAAGIEHLVRRGLGRPRLALASEPMESRLARIPRLFGQALLDLIPLAAFAGTAYASAMVVKPGPDVQAVGLSLVNAYAIFRGLIVVGHLALAPGAPSLRLLPLSQQIASRLFLWFRRFVGVGVSGYFVADAARLLGIPGRGYVALINGVGVALTGVAIAFILQNRADVARWLRQRCHTGPDVLRTGHLLRGLAAVWHILAIAYVVGFFMIWIFEIKGGMEFMVRGTIVTALTFRALWLVLAGLRRGVEHVFALTKEERHQHPRLRERAVRYLPALHGMLSAITVMAAALVVLQAWGIHSLRWIQTPLGVRVLSASLSILIVVGIAVVVWELASSGIERYLAEIDHKGRRVERSARVRTLLPLLRKALFIFLSVIVVLLALSEIGVNIGPLLAGAGVIGLAIGFGAQKLVQDVITGVFILVEDAIAVGDVVSVAGIGGRVEDLSIRSIRLRDVSGNVHTIPFSSVGTVTNMTKVFSYYPLDISVAYHEDIDRVTEFLKKIVEEMRADPAFGPDILEPLEVMGVDKFTDSAVILKARIKTRPIKQWAVGREFNRRMKKRFDEFGIGMPFQYRNLGADRDGSVPSARVDLNPAPALAATAPSAPDPSMRSKASVVDWPPPSPHLSPALPRHAGDGERATLGDGRREEPLPPEARGQAR